MLQNNLQCTGRYSTQNVNRTALQQLSSVAHKKQINGCSEIELVYEEKNVGDGLCVYYFDSVDGSMDV